MGKIAYGPRGKKPGQSLKEAGQKGNNDTNKKNADLMTRHANVPKL